MTYQPGGFVPGPPNGGEVKILLALDECILDRMGLCRRRALRHRMTRMHRATKEIYSYNRWLNRERARKGYGSAELPLRLRMQLHWWHLRVWFGRCPECRQRGYLGNGPRWEDDKVAQMLGVAAYGCPCCGKGATEERDAKEGT